MTYRLDTSHTSPNQNKGRSGNKVSAITIHYWGSRGQKHANVVSWLCNPKAGTSAHYVASDGLVSCIVAPDNTAWHSGSRVGNRTTIGIECRPEMSDGDFRTVAELIADLRRRYGNLPLVPHKKWTSTDCPGPWEKRLGELSRLADSLTGHGSGASAPAPAAKPASGKLDEDGKLGPATAKRFQSWLGVSQDGKLGNGSWSGLQRKVGTIVDGVISHQSKKASEVGSAITQGWQYDGPGARGSKAVVALQKVIGVTADGIWGSGTTLGLQKYLNRL